MEILGWIVAYNYAGFRLYCQQMGFDHHQYKYVNYQDQRIGLLGVPKDKILYA